MADFHVLRQAARMRCPACIHGGPPAGCARCNDAACPRTDPSHPPPPAGAPSLGARPGPACTPAAARLSGSVKQAATAHTRMRACWAEPSTGAVHLGLSLWLLRACCIEGLVLLGATLDWMLGLLAEGKGGTSLVRSSRTAATDNSHYHVNGRRFGWHGGSTSGLAVCILKHANS